MYKQALLFTIFAIAQAQRVSNGLCNFENLKHHPDPTPIDGSNLFVIKRITNTWNTGHCASWHFTSNENSMVISLKEVVDTKLIVRNGTCIESDDMFAATFPDFSADFTVIGGKDNLILYACKNQGNNKQEYAWVLALNRTISQSVRNEADKAIRDNNLNDAAWEEISHSEPCSNHVTGAANNFNISPFILLIVGCVVLKVL